MQAPQETHSQISSKGKWITNPQVRKWLYDIAIAVCGILAVTGVVSGNIIESVNVLLAALFAVARVNIAGSDDE